jgi:hypothetical protein
MTFAEGMGFACDHWLQLCALIAVVVAGIAVLFHVSRDACVGVVREFMGPGRARFASIAVVTVMAWFARELTSGRSLLTRIVGIPKPDRPGTALAVVSLVVVGLVAVLDFVLLGRADAEDGTRKRVEDATRSPLDW